MDEVRVAAAGWRRDRHVRVADVHRVQHLRQHHHHAGANQDAELPPRHQSSRFVFELVIVKMVLVAHKSLLRGTLYQVFNRRFITVRGACMPRSPRPTRRSARHGAGVIAARLEQPRHRAARAVERLNIVTPLRCEYWPVRMAARLGVQIEFVANTLVSSAPSRARRSRWGVWFTRDPYAMIACAAWSSDMMKRMFGRSASRTGTTASSDNGEGHHARTHRHTATRYQRRAMASRPPATSPVKNRSGRRTWIRPCRPAGRRPPTCRASISRPDRCESPPTTSSPPRGSRATARR